MKPPLVQPEKPFFRSLGSDTSELGYARKLFESKILNLLNNPFWSVIGD